MSDDELVTAYLDGVAELTPDERRRAEALIDANPADAEATAGILAELRALPPPPDPDFRLLEATISQALPPPVARGYRWGAVSGVLAAAATIALFVAVRHDLVGRTPTVPDAPSTPLAPAPPVVATQQPAPPDDSHIYFNDADDLDDLDLDDVTDDDAIDDALSRDDDLGDLDDYVSIQGGDGFGSQFGAEIDQLDDAALDRLDSWLATKKGG